MFEYYREYIGVFVALIASATVVPIPEEIPVITAGILVGHSDTEFADDRDNPKRLRWYIMLPVVMAGVVVGDGVLYAIGRLWGRRLLNWGWVKRRLVTPEKREQIEKNFHERGIMILLGARLLPGIRGPIFVMAGVLRVPLGRFMIADAIYAIPLVNILFWLAYFLTDQMMVIFRKIEGYRELVVVAILSGIAGALIQKYILSRHVSTGDPPHVPDIIAKPAVAVGHAVEKAVEIAVEKVTGRHHTHEPEIREQKPEDRDQRSEAREQRSEDGKQKTEIGSQTAENNKQETEPGKTGS